ncbi:TDT family transporter [Streptomyces sp. AV19]|uniref:TDT family transporter n=1 Tax=Streptomyces sp. AV19 TaxID=2793068 RepID=UPI001F1E1B34|nr:TDT family transporter [Streptomyces sp. AV19]MDG4536934.1 TDT family transporter [Streptomyces sp. AV19]
MLRDLEHPGQLFQHLGPNWYATVMGTAIVANAGATLPLHIAGLHTFAICVWAFSLLLLVLVLTARGIHLVRHRNQARAHLFDPAVAPFYGCPPMALLAVGAGTALVGKSVLGTNAALAIDWVLWGAGTVLGLLVAVALPYLMITKHDLAPGTTTTTLLLPIVAPMVSAATGPFLIPHLPPGQPRETMLLGCYAMFGLSLLATMVILPGVWSRLIYHKVGPLLMTPTLWLVLGPLGQSTTAVNSLGDSCCGATDKRLEDGLQVFAVIYGVPVMGFAFLWLALAAAVTLQAFLNHMPFAMTWWSFTFPVGTCVTGIAGLARHTGLKVYIWLAVLLYLLLLATWLITATRTLLGVLRGTLFLPPHMAQAHRDHP